MLTSPVIDGTTVVGVLGVVRDVGEEKLLVEQLVQQEKLAAIGQLVSGVAHELNNPLASVMAFSQLVLANRRRRCRARRRTAHDSFGGEARREDRVESADVRATASAAAHDDVGERRHLERARDASLCTHGSRRRARGATRSHRSPPSGRIRSSFSRCCSISSATPSRRCAAGKARQRIAVTSEVRGGRIVVTVRDSGPGIPAAEIDRVFNPFYTTKGDRQGHRSRSLRL